MAASFELSCLTLQKDTFLENMYIVLSYKIVLFFLTYLVHLENNESQIITLNNLKVTHFQTISFLEFF